MARVRKPTPTLESFFFATPEQKVFRLLLSEPTTSFTPRVISSKLKGVRGLGGGGGIHASPNESAGPRARRFRRQSPRRSPAGRELLRADYEDLRRDQRSRRRFASCSSRSPPKAFCSAAAPPENTAPTAITIFSSFPRRPRKSKKSARAIRLQKDRSSSWFGRRSSINEFEERTPVFAEKLAEGVVLWGSTW